MKEIAQQLRREESDGKGWEWNVWGMFSTWNVALIVSYHYYNIVDYLFISYCMSMCFCIHPTECKVSLSTFVNN